MTSRPTARLRLWYSPGACSFVPQVVLLELGLSAELILTPVGRMSDEFKVLNPKARVPVLSLDNEVITEMPAILTALSSLAPDAKLFGRTELERVRVYEWLNYLCTTLHSQGYGSVWRPERYADDPKLHPAIIERGRQTIRECYSLIESKLESERRLYVVGDGFTVVDPFLALFYRWASRLEFDMEADYPRYASYSNRLLKRLSLVEARKTHDKV